MTRRAERMTAGFGLDLTPQEVSVMRERLPGVADAAVRAIITEVPSYADALSGAMGENIRNAVQLALGGFIQLAARSSDANTRPGAPAMEGAYQLGRGEARSGRSMEALLAAFRVGARISWDEMSASLLSDGVDAETLAKFAGLVFAYIDQLSASSVAGHADESATTGWARQQLRDSLATALLRGDPLELLTKAADRAVWELPETLTAVVLPEPQLRTALASVDPRTLTIPDPRAEELSVLLVPDAHRAVLLRAVSGSSAVVGPTRSWDEVRLSWLRASRARALGPQIIDTEDHLAELVTTADPDALADLRDQVLAPLGDLGDSAQEKLTGTLRAWLLHQGRRDAVAEALFVHPQTVRYRVGQLREAYGERLDDPHFVRDATIALA